jgi:AmmeMemoRadiSam system protein B/AmmeMemoRadiSam system protein A
MKTTGFHKAKVSLLLLFAALFLLIPRGRTGMWSTADASDTANEPEKVHESVIAGSWYPASSSELRQQVQGFLDRAPVREIPGKLVALISPHAGYVYSGQVAAYAYKLLLKQKFETVVLIGPSHHASFRGVAVYDRGGFRTPLGTVPLDCELVSALEKQDTRIRYVEGAHTMEHSLEIQLPFLQTVMPGFKLVPLMMGDQDLDTCQWLAKAVVKAIGNRSVLVVASSDLSHFHPDERAKQLDQTVADKVNNFDPEGLSSSLARNECEACGGGPIVTTMLIARLKGANKAQVLHCANSGDVTGDRKAARGGVVGYLAGAVWVEAGGSAKSGTEDKKVGVDLGLSAGEKALLHRMVQETIEARCKGEKTPRFQVVSSRLKEPRGAFVTLRKNGELRGCIGHITSDRPLAETVAEMSVAAAFQDPRFRPVSSDELKELSIEISVLTPLTRIDNPDELQVGLHGIYMRRNGRAGLLLPQVATEYGWDRTTFLEQTCRKAGLPKDAWKDKETEIYIFSADVF